MNTEASQEQVVSKTTGMRLRQARELLGLTRQIVAERLCLKVSTIRDIEEDKAQVNLAPTFIRGYIRSYARLVRLPEDELLSVLENDSPVVLATEIAPEQSFLLGKKRKIRDGWLMNFTWLIIVVVLGLTGAWWWQNHQANQEEIASMVDNSAIQLSQSGEQQSAALKVINNTVISSASDNSGKPVSGTSGAKTNTENKKVIENNAPRPIHTIKQQDNGADNANNNIPLATTNGLVRNSGGVPQSLAVVATSQSPLPNAQTSVGSTGAGARPLVMDFTEDCWVEVITEATGEILFKNLQKKGTKLELNLEGSKPYKLVIGAPEVAQVHYKGKLLDLSGFVEAKKIARLIIR